MSEITFYSAADAVYAQRFPDPILRIPKHVANALSEYVIQGVPKGEWFFTGNGKDTVVQYGDGYIIEIDGKRHVIQEGVGKALAAWLAPTAAQRLDREIAERVAENYRLQEQTA